MIILFVCKHCGGIFHEPIHWKEDRGECFGFPTYEEFCGSPCCRASFATAFQCDCCGEYITTETYIKTSNDERYCEECFQCMTLGEED